MTVASEVRGSFGSSVDSITLSDRIVMKDKGKRAVAHSDNTKKKRGPVAPTPVKGKKKGRKKKSIDEPVGITDRYNAVFIIFNFLGIASLLPWNFFTTAKKYFDYKFRNTSLPPGTPFDSEDVATDLQTSFESYLAISSMLSNLIFMFFTMLCVRNISLNVRMVVSSAVIIIIFTMTVVLVNVDTDSWQFGFFLLTMISAAIMVGLTSVMTGSIFGLSCLFPSRYTRSAMSGQALGGTLAAVAMIVALAAGEDERNSAFGYFVSATVASVLALVAYFSLYYLKYSKYFLVNQEDNKICEVNEEMPSYRDLLTQRQYFASIISKVWPYCTTVCLVFFVTLACYPGLASIIKSVNYEAGDAWTDKYFSAVVCFLLFNVGDWVGRSVTSWVHVPRNGQGKLMMVLAVLRVAFLPLLMLCNAKPHDRQLPVILNSDIFPIVFILLLGLTNGYLSTLAMVYGPTHVRLEQAEGAGLVMTFGLVLGLACGSFFSLLLIALV
ncbi:hypothetical protein BaRGS_00016377 [Batillaria attramentaria]|uniref:Equilibrative nucleoside transporter 1 n=1 Tax=Batillaria attramentaria TaxID=370345 RepID=A0ABD0KZK7_9CAEN